ncbi:hypothetical protein GC176_26425 [bacterium]|nr:hypothetical protein [bacterium]
MKNVLILILTIFATGMIARGEDLNGHQASTALLALYNGHRAHVIDIQVTVDTLPFDTYWTKTFDAIFEFADCNSDGVLNKEELALVPSARAVRLSLGSAFTPPVASIQSLDELVTDQSQACSREELRQYYRRHGAGRLQIGCGQLPNTSALTNALIQTLDEDQDGRLSRMEFQNAEATLRRFDANDDELIGVGELVPNAVYPGSSAGTSLRTSRDVDLSQAGNASLMLQRLQAHADVHSFVAAHADDQTEPASGVPIERATWKVVVSDQVHDLPLKLATNARCEGWSVPGPLSELYGILCEEIANAESGLLNEESGKPVRDRHPYRAWLTPLVDRDRDGKASQQEIDRWLALQRQLIHGQLLISVYYGGGLFELLDVNHDAGLSIRELRAVWQTLESASCTSGGQVTISQIPEVVLVVVSQGYPGSIARTSMPEVEWFRLMDRNADGDVSRREFTGSPDTFNRLDENQDGLISPREAAMGS